MEKMDVESNSTQHGISWEMNKVLCRKEGGDLGMHPKEAPFSLGLNAQKA